MKNKVAVMRRAKALPQLGGVEDPRERRLHLRAHRYWSTLKKTGAVPLWEDFDPLMIDDRCTQSFVLDLSIEGALPSIRLIGSALQAEGGLDAEVIGLDDAPAGSLLMRLTTFFPELVSRAVPLSVEAPFETSDGRPGIYRGLLMPFSSSGDTIDIVFGVVSWRELVSPCDSNIPSVPRPAARVISIR